MVSSRRIGVDGGNQCNGIEGTGKHLGPNAADAVGKHFGTHAADALGEHFGPNAPNTLEVTSRKNSQ